MITPQTDSIRGKCPELRGPREGNLTSEFRLLISNIMRAFNTNTCARVVFPHNALHFPLRDVPRDDSLRGDGQYRGVKLMKTQWGGKRRRQTNPSPCHYDNRRGPKGGHLAEITSPDINQTK